MLARFVVRALRNDDDDDAEDVVVDVDDVDVDDDDVVEGESGSDFEEW